MNDTNPLSKIEHVVVVMLENRSFDNLLGWLYDPSNEPPYNVVPEDFEGLHGKDLSNRTSDGRVIPVGKTDDPRSPQPNPGEPFEDVYSQIYGLSRVAFEDTPATPPHPANMQGFIRNYEQQKSRPKHPETIMNALTPKAVPVLSSLAHHYALCDNWFASIPTQTFCNRSFVHAGTSSGYVNNSGHGLCFINDTPTIFDLLDEAEECTWEVYVGGWKLQSFTLLTQKRLWKHVHSHFAHFRSFLAATAKKNGLPSYSFIEPIYFDSLIWGPENDMHPECNPYEFYGPSNLHRGEALVATIYDAVRNSPDWESILLVVLFDEHGGCYDHIAPPGSSSCSVAINPDGEGRTVPRGQPGGIGFNFDRLGPRVPAIIVSPYTPPQSRLHGTYEHTSVLSTVIRCFELPSGRLRQRQEKALDLGAAVTLASPRSDRPPIAKPHYSLSDWVKDEWRSIVHAIPRDAAHNKLTDLQKTALHAAALLTGAKELSGRVEKLRNELEADRLIAGHEARFLGKSSV